MKPCQTQIFLVNLPIGLAGLWLAWRFADETTRTAEREIDLPGQIAAIVALGSLAGAIIEAGSLGWSHSLVIAGFAVFAAFAVGSYGAKRARRNRCCRSHCLEIGCSH